MEVVEQREDELINLKSDKFLFFFDLKPENVLKGFLCLSLRQGVVIISILYLICSLLSLYHLSLYTLATNIAILIGSIWLLYGVYYNSYKNLYYGYFIVVIVFYLEVVRLAVAGLILIVMTFGFAVFYLIFFVVFLAIAYIIQIIFLLVIYSYFLELKASRINSYTQTEQIEAEII